jgi:hypothetical protein
MPLSIGTASGPRTRPASAAAKRGTEGASQCVCAGTSTGNRQARVAPASGAAAISASSDRCDPPTTKWRGPLRIAIAAP